MSKTNDLATKTFVKEVVEKTEEKLRQEIKGTEGKLRQELGALQTTVKKNHEEVIERLDSIAGSIKKFDEEQTILSYRVSEHTDQLENHEKRIKKIEETTLPSST